MKIMVVGEGAAGVALGIAAECHRQNALMHIYTDCKPQAEMSRKLFVDITGQEPVKREGRKDIPEFGK